MKRPTFFLILVLILALFISLALFYLSRRSAEERRGPTSGAHSPANKSDASYVGGNVCKSCHEKEYQAWMGSDHQLAMQEATSQTVLGDFHDAKFSYFGVASRFFTSKGRFYVHTDGPDGKLRDYEIKFTFGVHPLQQYLIAFPDGRLQALSIAWDSRPKELGGQRWFHLYPKENIRPGDELHWTNIQQNWNFMCAECHATDLKKNYEQTTNTFKTTWAEISVSCEACHGAGSAHVDWAKRRPQGSTSATPADDGLPVHFKDRRDVYWKMNYITGNSQRSRPRANTDELETCGRCHARRSELVENYVPGRPLLDTHRISLLEPHLFTADGQMQDEVYNYASFLQSRMFHEGVTCSDCHDPHTLKLRQGEEDQVCGICHDLHRYAATAHHHHREGSREARCTSCHMSVRTYMIVDPRHDHSFRIPRPDDSVKFGTPNACNDCHKDKSPAWAAAATQRWYGLNHKGYQQYTGTLTGARRNDQDAAARLVALAKDDQAPNIARATALVELQPYLDADTYAAARVNLQSLDPLLRLAAVELVSVADAASRWRMLSPLLTDPVLAVRIATAYGVADALPPKLSPEEQDSFDHALSEYVAVQKFNADRPEAHVNLGSLYSRQGQTEKAEAEYHQALQLLPSYIPAYVNLADLSRATGNDKESERWLLEALTKAPNDAAALHSLGLLRVRQHRTADALALLGKAMKFAPRQPRFAYVYGVGLYSAGQTARGLEVLRTANQRFPGDREILLGLATLSAEAGDISHAKLYAKKLAEVSPSDPRAGTLLQQLEKSHP
jgi:Flp pilus assembly protein TadD/ssDNA-binding Zn-finger/Zn-ribbon topoisomerase 1